MTAGRRKALQAEATRAALVDAARELFGERGYADVGTQEIVERAGVTKGALYHHFRDKRELFLAVFHAVQQEVVAKVATAARAEEDPGRALTAALQCFLDLSGEQEVQQVVLLDGPAVFGWGRWRDLDTDYALGLLREVLQRGIDDGYLAPQPVETLASVVLAALNEGVLLIAHAARPRSARSDVESVLAGVFSSLRTRA